MGVMCQILLHRPLHGYWKPGGNVSGVLKYAIDEETVYSGITISLVGKGYCHWTERSTSKNRSNRHYRGNEEYLKIKTNVLNKNEGETVNIQPGSYEFQFGFMLPDNLPPTYKDAHSKISYGIIVKFKRPGFFQFNKTFQVETVVGGSFYAELPQRPMAYNLDKSLFSLFSSRENVINLKAEIEKFFLVNGESANLNFVVTNDSKVIIPSVQIELYSVTTYTASSGRQKRDHYKLSESTVETASIPDSSKSYLSAILQIPNGIYSVQHSKIISKEWKLKVIVKLPFPHINASVNLPIVIAKSVPAAERVTEALDSDDDEVKPSKSDDAPPSYWEAMAEDDGKGGKLFES